MWKKLLLQLVGAVWITTSILYTTPLCAQLPGNYLKGLLKPNPNSPRDLMELLQNPSVANEVGVDSAALKEIQSKQMELYRERRVTPPTDMTNEQQRTAFMAKMKEQREALDELIKQAIEELLPPEKMERLKQIAYRFEVQKLGFAASLSEGWLADVVETHDAQQATLMRKIGDIEAELQKKVDQLRAEAEAEILAQLTPEQRAKARKALGEPAKCRLMSTEEVLMNRSRESMKEVMKMQAELAAPK